jgi:hypothetical protein
MPIDLSRLPPIQAGLVEHLAMAYDETKHITLENDSSASLDHSESWPLHGLQQNGEQKWCDDNMILPQTSVHY